MARLFLSLFTLLSGGGLVSQSLPFLYRHKQPDEYTHTAPRRILQSPRLVPFPPGICNLPPATRALDHSPVDASSRLALACHRRPAAAAAGAAAGPEWAALAALDVRCLPKAEQLATLHRYGLNPAGNAGPPPGGGDGRDGAGPRWWVVVLPKAPILEGGGRPAAG